MQPRVDEPATLEAIRHRRGGAHIRSLTQQDQIARFSCPREGGEHRGIDPLGVRHLRPGRRSPPHQQQEHNDDPSGRCDHTHGFLPW